jgi:hypothetical protein
LVGHLSRGPAVDWVRLVSIRSARSAAVTRSAAMPPLGQRQCGNTIHGRQIVEGMPGTAG